MLSARRLNLPEQKQQQESISASEGSNLRERGTSSTIQDKSGKCLTQERFPADGQNIAQNCTTMTVVETTLYWTAASPRKKICNQSSVRKLRL